MQNPYSKLLFVVVVLFCFLHKICICFQKFFCTFAKNLWLNFCKTILYLIICNLKIIQENAFSEVGFSTLVPFLDLNTISDKICSTNQSSNCQHLVRFNKQLAENGRLREELEHLRQDKSVYDAIYKKLRKHLEYTKEEMNKIINQASQAYEER